jgi:hypothetical protein
MDGQFREAPGKAVTLDKCRTISANALLKKASSAKNDKRNRVRTTLVRHFWDQDKQYIPDLPELTEKVKYFFKKHAPDS